jgi:hypothetical protein
MTEMACPVCDRRRDGGHQLDRPEMPPAASWWVVRVLDQRARRCHESSVSSPCEPLGLRGFGASTREIDLLLSRVEVNLLAGMEIDLRFPI